MFFIRCERSATRCVALGFALKNCRILPKAKYLARNDGLAKVAHFVRHRQSDTEGVFRAKPIGARPQGGRRTLSERR